MEHVIVSIVAQISKTYKPFLSAVVRNHIAQKNGFFAANRGQRRNIGYRRIAKGGCSHHFWQRLEMFGILKFSLVPQPKKTLNPSYLVLSLESFARIRSLADWHFDGNLLFDRVNVVFFL